LVRLTLLLLSKYIHSGYEFTVSDVTGVTVYWS